MEKKKHPINSSVRVAALILALGLILVLPAVLGSVATTASIQPKPINLYLAIPGIVIVAILILLISKFKPDQ